eukprot:CAMPEP_0117034442 /NCGR_PEP_ID=MMETSP0472-20121206/24521_1 /TAXON_ID=693140 ORGANISM="Tiarina fusus, Strain LIS" /NCGR_SAMPLE_ID=MMETSP0472 /ASSEMBLY_ACC=CAM_ASM_000603 /LENGTH=240 /DNA_ID=CAMNT_0004743613 /DNA_START=121 /DNA_END=843 /DNA_ORIENTATION=+
MEYVMKDAEPTIEDPDALKKRFLMDLHPNLVQSKAFSRASVGSLRLNAATLHEGQHPVIQECIKEANVIDNALDSELTTHKEDPVFEFTRCFPYSNYRKGDEDSILKLDIDWDFFRAAFPDGEFIDQLRVDYDNMLEDMYQETITENPIPEEVKVFERFSAQIEEHIDARLEPLFATAEDAEYDLRHIPDAIEEIIHEWDDVRVWTCAPRIAAEIQNSIDNEEWLFEDESIWLQTDKAIR